MLKIEYIPITDIKPYAKNAKLHPPEQIAQIKASIEAFGFNDPIGLWHGEIVEGHGRYLAAKELGMTELPVIKLDGLTDEQRRAYMLAHNKLTMNSGFDLDLLNEELEAIAFDMTAFGFDMEEEADDSAVEEDYYQEEAVEPRTKLGDRNRLGDHILLCGDATKADDMKKLMDGQVADMLVTDPPYNVDYLKNHIEKQIAIGTSYKAAGVINGKAVGTGTLNALKNDAMSEKEFDEFLTTAMERMKENLKKGGVFYIFYPNNSEFTFLNALKKTKNAVRQVLIWNKNHSSMGRQDYRWKHEPIIYGWTEGAAHYFIDDMTQRTVIEEPRPDIEKMKKAELVELLKEIYSDRVSSTVINEDIVHASDLHPTMKPLKLLGRLIANSSQRGETVLDLFGGSGSTMMACEQLGRRCYTMELDPHYCDVIIDRWEKYTGRQAEKLT